MKKTFQRIASALTIVALTMAFVACNKPEPKKPEPKKEVTDADIKKVEFLDVSDYASWVYYSLKDNKVYKTAKYDLASGELKDAPVADDKNWDIAFHRWDVMTRGGALKSDIKDLKKAYEVKQGSFTKDQEGEVTIIFKMGPDSKKVKAMVNPLISGGYQEGGWIFANISTMPPKYTVAENIWFVKTADGKTAALQFKGAKKKDGKTGAVTLDYIILK